MSLGLVGASGADALRQSIRQRLIDQAAQERNAQEMDLAERRMKLSESEAGMRAEEHRQNGEDRRFNFDRLKHADEVEAQARDFAAAQRSDEATAPGFIPDVPETKQLTGRLQMVGAVTPQMGRSAVDEGPLMPGDTGAAMPDGFNKRPTYRQVEAHDTADAKVAAAAQAAQDRADAQGQAAQDRLAQIHAAAAGRQPVDHSLADEMTRLRIQGEKDKQDAAHKAASDKESAARQSTDMALELVNRLKTHPGLSKGTGIIGSRLANFSQEATDASGLRDQLVASLTAPNLGALKGPMSDKDIIFVKQLATRLGNHQLSEAETRKALSEAETFLHNKGAGGGAKADPLGLR